MKARMKKEEEEKLEEEDGECSNYSSALSARPAKKLTPKRRLLQLHQDDPLVQKRMFSL
jgi:hypothetical protein